MLQRPLTTSKNFLEARQDFDQIPTVHVSYASSYLTLLQCNLVEHPIVDIWEDLDTLKFFQHEEYPSQVTLNHWDRIQHDPNATHGRTITLFDAYRKCRNPSFGLATKAKGLQGCGPKGSPGVTSETPGSAGECEGLSLHIPKATPTLGDGLPVDS